jgi:hypothetical protein
MYVDAILGNVIGNSALSRRKQILEEQFVAISG